MGKKDITQEGASSRRLSGSSAILSSGRLSLYTENAFRVLGMPVDATDMELQERHDTLKAYATLKRVEEVYTIAFGCKPPPSAHQLDAALERLNDGEQRASDEFFWFWPREVGAEDDPGIEAIAEGNAAEALQTWREWELEDGLARAVARHNLAVNYLILALEQTARHLAGDLAQAKRAKLTNAWKNADRRWGEVADDKHTWEETKKRILSKGDPALTAALAEEMKSDLSKTLAAIHGDIARHYAEKGMMESAKFHVDAMIGDSGSVDDDCRSAIREVAKPVRDRLEAARAQAQSHANSTEPGKKKQAAAKARAFFENDFEQKAKPLLDLFYTGDADLKKEKEGIYDKVAETICNCCVAAFNARGQAGESQEDDTPLMKKALEIATDRQLRERINKNMSSSGGGISGPVEVQAAIVSVIKDKDTTRPSARFRRLQSVRPKFKEWVARNRGKEECRTLSKMFSMLERALSVEIFNKENDRALAIVAIKCAIEDAMDPEDREKFKKDLETLAGGGGGDDVQEVLVTIAEVSKGGGAASVRLRKLLGVRSKLKAWAAKHPGSDESKRMLKVFAMMERSLSVDTVNSEAVALLKGGDLQEARELIALAVLAIDNAIQDTPDDDDRKKFRKDRTDLNGIIDTVGGVGKVRIPESARRTGGGNKSKAPSSGGFGKRMMWTCLLGVAALVGSSVYNHYLPGGWNAVEWWHIAIAGAVLGFVFPWGRLPYPLPQLLKAFTIWGAAGTAIVTGLVIAYNGADPEAFVPELWRATLIGFSISGMITAPYWLLTFVSQYADGPTARVKYVGMLSMPLFYLGVTFFLFSFSKDHVFLLAGLPMLQWWHFPIAGVVMALFVPTLNHRSFFFMMVFFMVMWPATVAAWLGIVAYNALAPETAALGQWWAPYAALVFTYLALVFRLERLPVSLARMEKGMKS